MQKQFPTQFLKEEFSALGAYVFQLLSVIFDLFSKTITYRKWGLTIFFWQYLFNYPKVSLSLWLSAKKYFQHNSWKKNSLCLGAVLTFSFNLLYLTCFLKHQQKMGPWDFFCTVFVQLSQSISFTLINCKKLFSTQFLKEEFSALTQFWLSALICNLWIVFKKL